MRLLVLVFIAILALCAVASASMMEQEWFHNEIRAHWSDSVAQEDVNAITLQVSEDSSKPSQIGNNRAELSEGLASAAKVLKSGTCSVLGFAPRPSTPTLRAPSCLSVARRPNGTAEWNVVKELAAKFAPNFHYNIDESNFPDSVLSFIDHSNLESNERGNFYALKSWVYKRGSLDFSSARVYVDFFIRDAVLNVKYYTFYPQTSKLFTGLNIKAKNLDIALDKLMEMNPFGVHEGDWEITEAHVDLNTTSLLGVTTWEPNPNGVASKPLYHEASKLSLTDGRPNLFVASGSHNVYTKPGNFRLFAGYSRCGDKYDTVYLGSDLQDRALGNGKVWHTHGFLRAIRDPSKPAPAWLNYEGFFGNMKNVKDSQVACRPAGRAELAGKVFERLSFSAGFVDQAIRSDFSQAYVDWVCGPLSQSLFAWLDDPVGVKSPVSEFAQAKSIVEQTKQCKSVESYSADREQGFNLVKTKHAEFKLVNGKAMATRQLMLAARVDFMNAQQNYTNSVVAARKASKNLDSAREVFINQKSSVITGREILADLKRKATTPADLEAIISYTRELVQEEKKAKTLRHEVKHAKLAFHHAVQYSAHIEALMLQKERILAELRVVRYNLRDTAKILLVEFEGALAAYEKAAGLESQSKGKAAEDAMTLAKRVNDKNKQKILAQQRQIERAINADRMKNESSLAKQLAAEIKVLNEVFDKKSRVIVQQTAEAIRGYNHTKTEAEVEVQKQDLVIQKLRAKIAAIIAAITKQEALISAADKSQLEYEDLANKEVELANAAVDALSKADADAQAAQTAKNQAKLLFTSANRNVTQRAQAKVALQQARDNVRAARGEQRRITRLNSVHIRRAQTANSRLLSKSQDKILYANEIRRLSVIKQKLDALIQQAVDARIKALKVAHIKEALVVRANKKSVIAIKRAEIEKNTAEHQVNSKRVVEKKRLAQLAADTTKEVSAALDYKFRSEAHRIAAEKLALKKAQAALNRRAARQAAAIAKAKAELAARIAADLAADQARRNIKSALEKLRAAREKLARASEAADAATQNRIRAVRVYRKALEYFRAQDAALKAALEELANLQIRLPDATGVYRDQIIDAINHLLKRIEELRRAREAALAALKAAKEARDKAIADEKAALEGEERAKDELTQAEKDCNNGINDTKDKEASDKDQQDKDNQDIEDKEQKDKDTVDDKAKDDDKDAEKDAEKDREDAQKEADKKAEDEKKAAEDAIKKIEEDAKKAEEEAKKKEEEDKKKAEEEAKKAEEDAKKAEEEAKKKEEEEKKKAEEDKKKEEEEAKKKAEEEAKKAEEEAKKKEEEEAKKAEEEAKKKEEEEKKKEEEEAKKKEEEEKKKEEEEQKKLEEEQKKKDEEEQKKLQDLIDKAKDEEEKKKLQDLLDEAKKAAEDAKKNQENNNSKADGGSTTGSNSKKGRYSGRVRDPVAPHWVELDSELIE